MKNFLKRFLILLVVFVLGVAGTSFLMNSETTDEDKFYEYRDALAWFHYGCFFNVG